MEPPTIKGSCCLLRVCPARLPIVNSAPNIAFYRALTGSQPCTKFTGIVIKFSSPFTDTFMIHFSQLMKLGEDWLMLPQGGAEGAEQGSCRTHSSLLLWGSHFQVTPLISLILAPWDYFCRSPSNLPVAFLLLHITVWGHQ